MSSVIFAKAINIEAQYFDIDIYQKNLHNAICCAIKYRDIPKNIKILPSID